MTGLINDENHTNTVLHEIRFDYLNLSNCNCTFSGSGNKLNESDCCASAKDSKSIHNVIYITAGVVVFLIIVGAIAIFYNKRRQYKRFADAYVSHYMSSNRPSDVGGHCNLITSFETKDSDALSTESDSFLRSLEDAHFPHIKLSPNTRYHHTAPASSRAPYSAHPPPPHHQHQHQHHHISERSFHRRPGRIHGSGILEAGEEPLYSHLSSHSFGESSRSSLNSETRMLQVSPSSLSQSPRSVHNLPLLPLPSTHSATQPM